MSQDPTTLLRQGHLSDALVAMQDVVRKSPADGGHRFALASLLAFAGQWQRCATQLSVFFELTPAAALTARLYQTHVLCEMFRKDVFAGLKTPLLLGEPEPWLAAMVQALSLAASGAHRAAEELRSHAFEQAETSQGTLNSESFEWIADADPRLGPCLELYLNKAYYWAPFSKVRSIKLNPPVDTMDLIWAPVTIAWVNGGESAAFMPVRYPGSEHHPEPAINLGRRTEFCEVDGVLTACIGQRLWSCDSGEQAMLDVRKIELSGSDV